MQKLFENWRRYQKESLNEFYSPRLEHGNPGKLTNKDLQALDEWRQVLSVADWTGVSSYPDFVRDYNKFRANPTLNSAGWLLLSAISIIPVIGKLATGAKASSAAARQMAGMAEATADTAKIIGKQWDKLGPMRAVKEAFDTGVIDSKKFFDWYKKEINPKAGREELFEAWNDTKKLFGHVESEKLDAFMLHGDANNQFQKIIQKYGVGVDPEIANGGWIVSLAKANPNIYNKFIKELDTIKKIPAAATGIAVGTAVAKVGGKRLFRAIFHEIGHVKFIQNFPSIAGKFLKEYRTLISRRISQIQGKYGLTDEMRALGDDLLQSTMHVTKAHQSRRIEQLLKMGLNKEQIMALYQSAVLRRTVDQIGAAGPEKIKVFLSDVYKTENYKIFQSGTKEVAKLLGLKGDAGAFYFLNFEEVFAELFEKSVRKRASGGALVGGNFPKTSAEIQKIIDIDIIPNLKESLLRENKSIILISIKR